MKWKQRTAEELDPKLIDKYQLSPIAAKLFSLRGINTDEKLNFWFNATEDDLADPSLMHDMDKAVKRINQAIDKGEKITVYGDYDADGITSHNDHDRDTEYSWGRCPLLHTEPL